MSSTLQQKYKNLSSKFLKISVREQLLILFCGLVFVILMMYTFLLESLLDNTQKLQKNSINVEKEISVLTVQVAKLYNKLKTDPNESVIARIAVLKRQIQDITRQIEAQTDHLVPANKMASMLESVLTGSKGLKLIELQSIPPVPILLGQSETSNEPQYALYRHGVSLEFEGSYFDIQRYLEKLESMPWQFYWKKFDYLVGDYPTASVELEIYTISTNKAFIGV
jgi:MSHA biogenesis protein MshJ